MVSIIGAASRIVCCGDASEDGVCIDKVGFWGESQSLKMSFFGLPLPLPLPLSGEGSSTCENLQSDPCVQRPSRWNRHGVSLRSLMSFRNSRERLTNVKPAS